MLKCPRCQGNVFLDDDELHCLQCGRRVAVTPETLKLLRKNNVMYVPYMAKAEKDKGR
jgi:hypothetical protein